MVTSGVQAPSYYNLCFPRVHSLKFEGIDPKYHPEPFKTMFPCSDCFVSS